MVDIFAVAARCEILFARERGEFGCHDSFFLFSGIILFPALPNDFGFMFQE